MNTKNLVPVGGACKYWYNAQGGINYGSKRHPLSLALGFEHTDNGLQLARTFLATLELFAIAFERVSVTTYEQRFEAK